MSSEPLVSVVVPAYNVEPYIAQCIESVLAQTVSDWEMVIVNDASTDGTVAVVERYLSDPRIRLVHNPQNIGLSSTRNRGFEEARGKWFALVDSDDWIAPHRLERLVEYAHAETLDMVADLKIHITEDGVVHKIGWSTFGTPPKFPRTYTIAEVIRQHPSCKPLIRRQFMRAHGVRSVPGLRSAEDYTLYIELMLKGAKFGVLPEGMYYYRLRGNSLKETYRGDDWVFWIEQSYNYLVSLPEAKSQPRIQRLLRASFRKRRMLAYYPLFASTLKRRCWAEALSIMRKEPSVVWMLLMSLLPAIYRRLVSSYKVRKDFG